MLRKIHLPLLLIYLCLCMFSCTNTSEKKETTLYRTHCASCHKAPEIDQLPKHIWKENILPRMAARMGISTADFDPKVGLSYSEQAAVLESGVYSPRPTISIEDWTLLRDYIIDLAPDSLPSILKKSIKPISKFKARTLAVDDSPTSRFTFLNYDKASSNILLGNMSGQLLNYDFKTDSTFTKHRFSAPVVDYHQKNSVYFATLIGKLSPTELHSGSLIRSFKNEGLAISTDLHRPVHTLVEDLNSDGTVELIVSEYGHLTGHLSILRTDSNGVYQKKVLLNQPGMLRTIAKDMNNDGKLDLVVASAQGDEGIWIFYQEEDLNFTADKVLRFSPVFGTSWFELLDYDGDGDQDIITAHGDNADYSFVPKPYHGIRIHLNNGKNEFKEVYFYPMYGATRLIAKDFDADNDVDIAVVATFPNYNKEPLQSFLYLDNDGGTVPSFTGFSFKEMKYGRWFLMDSGDIDADGDEDIIVSAFSHGFTPTSQAMEALWKEKQIDLLVLENQLKK